MLCFLQPLFHWLLPRHLESTQQIEVFLIPILFCGCETWTLAPALLAMLEILQPEIRKCILKLSKFPAHLVPIPILHLHPSKQFSSYSKVKGMTLPLLSFKYYLLTMSTVLVSLNKAGPWSNFVEMSFWSSKS